VKISSYRGGKEYFGRSVAHLSIIAGILSTIITAIKAEKQQKEAILEGKIARVRSVAHLSIIAGILSTIISTAYTGRQHK
jgi:energy-converting hydrogenase Eha subunit A